MNKNCNITTTQLGKYGEDIACDYLISQKYKIIERNYRASHNEIDIIVENKKYIVFVEVKTRTVDLNKSLDYGTPAMAVNASKQKRTIMAANAYLNEHSSRKAPRLDVIEVYLAKNDGDKVPTVININHMEDAFSN